MPWVCNECGIVKEVKIHGYQFGGRILKDVYFLATYDDKDKLVEVKIHPDYDDGYWHDLNTKKWLKEAKSYASDSADYEDCAKCNDEVVLDPIDDEGNPILEAHKFTKYVEVPPSNFVSKLEIEKQKMLDDDTNS